MEAVFASYGTKKVIEKFLTYRDRAPFYFPTDKPFGALYGTPVILPSWLSEEDVDYYTKKFEQTGFTGALNYYRCVDLLVPLQFFENSNHYPSFVSGN